MIRSVLTARADDAEMEVSIYYLCDEVAHAYRGLDLILNPSDWTKAYADLTATQLARALERIAAGVKLSRYRKHPRRPKKPPPKMSKKGRPHVSTARVLAAAKKVS